MRKPASGSIVPRRSFWSSLRPNARTVRPDTTPGADAGTPAAPTPTARRYLRLACVLACLAIIAGVAAQRSLARRRARLSAVPHLVSGRAGLRKTPSGVDERWSQGPITVTLDPTIVSATPGARDAITSAFGAWVSCGASLPQLSFDASSTPGPAAQDGVNRLLLGPITVAGEEKALAITISYADEESGAIIEADTIFNSAYAWGDVAVGASAGDDDGARCGGRYDLQNVATHEAGHFFGLGEDYQDESTTMYVSSRPCQTSKRTLSPPDVSVVSTMYASSPATAAGCGGR
jgi:hypothetical protein